jgi:hypothetical protein
MGSSAPSSSISHDNYGDRWFSVIDSKWPGFSVMLDLDGTMITASPAPRPYSGFLVTLQSANKPVAFSVCSARSSGHSWSGSQ